MQHRRTYLAILSLVILIAGVLVFANYPEESPKSSRDTHTASSRSGGLRSGSLSPSPVPSSSPSAILSPEPSGGTTTEPANCAPDPSACGFPDQSNTGVPAGTQLTVVTGDLKVSEAGAVVEGKEIHGCVLVAAPNVTIRNSRVSCADYYVIASFTSAYSGGGLLVEDSDISCENSNGTGIGYYGFVARRVHISGCENGFDIDDDAQVLDSYIHDLYLKNEAHTDGIQLVGGSNITIRHNTIFSPDGTSAIISHPTDNSDVLIEDNLLAGGAYTLYCPRESSSAFRVIDNRFSTLYSSLSGKYGPWIYCDQVEEAAGNVWDQTLLPLD